MADTANVLRPVTKQAQPMVGAGDVRGLKTIKPIIRGCSASAAVGLFAQESQSSWECAPAVSPQSSVAKRL